MAPPSHPDPHGHSIPARPPIDQTFVSLHILTRSPLLLRPPRRDGKRRLDESVRVIDLDVLAAGQQRPLTRLVGQVAPDLVAVLLGLERGDQVDAGPHLLAGEFTRAETLVRAKVRPVDKRGCRVRHVSGVEN